MCHFPRGLLHILSLFQFGADYIILVKSGSSFCKISKCCPRMSLAFLSLDALFAGCLPVLAESESNDMKKRKKPSKKTKATPVKQCRFLYFDTEREKLGYLAEAVSYRVPRRVKEVIFYLYEGFYPICPRCQRSIEREYMAYCDRCGQRLSWNRFSSAKERFSK